MATEKGKFTQQISGTVDTRGSLQAKPRRKRQLGRIIARVILIVLFVLAFFLSVLPWGRAATRALLLLPSLIGAAEPAPLTILDEPIRHTTMTISSSNGPVYLDVYAPTIAPTPIPGAREGLVVIPGVCDERKEPQLINFSQALAHAGLVVMDMTTNTLLNCDLSRQDTDGVVQAFQTLAHWPGVGANRIGIVGFSAGGPLACFAAADPRIRDQVASITLFGGYFNTISLLHDFGQRALLVDGHLQSWQPEEISIQVLANVIAPLLPDAEGTELVNAVAPGGTPLTSAELAQLSPETVAAYHLLVGDQPEGVDANIAALSPQVLTLLNQLSASTVINEIRAPIYLLHDRNDQYVPFTESRDFAAALTRIHHPHDFAEFGIFQHVEVRPDLGAGQILSDGSTLFRVLNEVLLAGS